MVVNSQDLTEKKKVRILIMMRTSCLSGDISDAPRRQACYKNRRTDKNPCGGVLWVDKFLAESGRPFRIVGQMMLDILFLRLMRLYSVATTYDK
jgi:hypothetical protein